MAVAEQEQGAIAESQRKVDVVQHDHRHAAKRFHVLDYGFERRNLVVQIEMRIGFVEQADYRLLRE